MDSVARCPCCKNSEDVVVLAVNLGTEKCQYESTNLCMNCHVVFGFRPLDEFGPVIQVAIAGEEIG